MKTSFALLPVARATALLPKTTALLSGAAACLFAGLPAHAQNATGEIVISASRTEQLQRDALPNTTVITRGEIERSGAASLPDLLRGQTGLEITQNGGPGTVASVFTRGAESRHTLVVVDGVPVNNLNFNTAAIEHMSLANIERVEIVRGNVAALYGSSALGGVIQIFTREGAKNDYAQLSLRAGSRNFGQVQAGLAKTFGAGTRISVNAENLADGGINATNQARLAGTNPDVDGYSRQSWSVGLSQAIGGGRISLSARETSGVTAYDSSFGPATQADESKFRLTGAGLQGEFPLGGALRVVAGVAEQADRLRADVTAFPYFVNSSSQNSNVGLRWQPAAGHQVTADVERVDQKIDSNTAYTRTTRTQDTVRAGYVGNLERHQIQLNLRQDNYSDFGAASTWLAGYGFRLTDAWRVSAQASTGFNAPTFNDLANPFGGNPNLRPEKLDSREVAVQYAVPNLEARLTWFSNDYTDLIANNALFQRVNVGRAQINGAELTLRGKLGDTTFNAGVTAQDPRDLTTNNRLTRRAMGLANAGVEHKLGAWTLGARLNHVGERTDGVNKLAAYTLLNLSAAYQLNPEWRFLAKIDNATDESYETAYGYRQPGASAFVGVSWQPKF